MKLYAYQPRGHGEYSFFVVAENEEQAFKHVDEHIKKVYGLDAYEVGGWGTDEYELTVFEPGQVAENDND